VQLLEGNVGYIDIRGFAGMETGKAMADAYMKLIERSDAIIIDLTRNGGGSPHTVQYLCSYFFDEEVHLNSLYWREGDRTDEFWTVEVDGIQHPDIPLFVMTSHYTFSGAEEFSYNMQTQKRATLVGQTTGGGANPGGGRMLNEYLTVFIPTGMAINPITGTNWEGVGVVPDIQTDPDSCFSITHQLAMEAAENYRARRRAMYTEKIGRLYTQLETYKAGYSEEVILSLLSDCVMHHIYEEWEINIMGYDYLMQYEKPRIAQCIFHANTILFPESANTFDSYGESLVATGDLEQAAESYRKAVELAEAHHDPNAQLFRDNLDRVLQMIREKK